MRKRKKEKKEEGATKKKRDAQYVSAVSRMRGAHCYRHPTVTSNPQIECYRITCVNYALSVRNTQRGQPIACHPTPCRLPPGAKMAKEGLPGPFIFFATSAKILPGGEKMARRRQQGVKRHQTGSNTHTYVSDRVPTKSRCIGVRESARWHVKPNGRRPPDTHDFSLSHIKPTQ